MQHVPSARSAARTTAAAAAVLVAAALGVLPAATARAATQPVSASTASSSPTPVTPPTTADVPSWAGATSESSPQVLPTVRAGEPSSADLRARDADGATYSLTTADGATAHLDDGLTFAHGVLSGTPTHAGTATVRVTATTAVGSAEHWVRWTVLPAAATGVGVVVRTVPAASDGTYTWVGADGRVYPDPLGVAPGGSLTLEPWTTDRFGNTVAVAEDAEVRASDDADRVDRADGPVTVTFAGAASQTVRVSVDGTATTFPVRVTGGRAATAPEGDATTAARVGQDPDGGPSNARSVADTAGELAWTGADAAVPIGWAVALLALGTAVVGLRRARRTRHRA
ncbi:hypothetical protein [Curtobacterium sp. NPDC092190]|uniref:hypothetical protein n=1 Tax=Curtobacterium sp. NPDC092190 TaxID=3363973 RepID=UPI0037FD5E68